MSSVHVGILTAAASLRISAHSGHLILKKSNLKYLNMLKLGLLFSYHFIDGEIWMIIISNTDLIFATCILLTQIKIQLILSN